MEVSRWRGIWGGGQGAADEEGRGRMEGALVAASTFAAQPP